MSICMTCMVVTGWERSSGALSLRTFADTAASTRVFNESYPAFIATLEDIVRRGISTVVLLGDYSDDGQPGAVTALKRILQTTKRTMGFVSSRSSAITIALVLSPASVQVADGGRQHGGGAGVE